MKYSNHSLPEAVQDALARFDYYSNRLKLEYLTCCFTMDFNQDVLQELKSYYGKEAVLAGGMNEAFRWFLGNPDVETIEALPTGEPFIETLTIRQGTGRLFKDYDPRSSNTCMQLESARMEILHAFQEASSLETKLEIMTEFFAIKVTCHDVFIHGRSDLPSIHLFEIPFVHIDPSREVDYVTQVLEKTPNDFRVKNILSFAMASGIDPVRCLSGDAVFSHRDRGTFIELVKKVLERIGEIDADSFFRWDIYGICNFIEGPVFLRRSNTRRCVSVLAEAWENYDWEIESTCTQASSHLAKKAFSIVFDHSEFIQSGSVEFFGDSINRLSLLKKIQEAEVLLDSLFRNRRRLVY